MTETTQCSLSHKGNPTVCETEQPGGCRGWQPARKLLDVKYSWTVMKSEQWRGEFSMLKNSHHYGVAAPGQALRLVLCLTH